MRRLAGIGLTTSAAFLAVVAVMLNSPSLFYMGTALVTMIAASRIQAWLAIRWLRFERIPPEHVRVGELATIELIVWSERRIRRPLVTVMDLLPPRLAFRDRTVSLPIAPSFDSPIQTSYSFVPLRRGKFRWNAVRIIGADALGIVAMERDYKTEAVELTVLPAPIAVYVELPTASGWGISEAETGQSRGAGIEPRGIREYRTGDSLRHVHWRTTARTGQLLVKEFEAGSHASVALLMQRTQGSERGTGAHTSLELMCGHAMYLAERFLMQGARVELPLLEAGNSRSGPDERLREIAEALATLQADSKAGLGEDVSRALSLMNAGSVLFVMMSVADPGFVNIGRDLHASGVHIVPLIYDAEKFTKRASGDSAASAAFLGQLEAAGFLPVLMPLWEEMAP